MNVGLWAEIRRLTEVEKLSRNGDRSAFALLYQDGKQGFGDEGTSDANAGEGAPQHSRSLSRTHRRLDRKVSGTVSRAGAGGDLQGR